MPPMAFTRLQQLSSARKGFTLAEVLITLGIIGVVSALTIPGLINNYKAARLKSQFTKVQSEIAQAVRMMKNDDISLDPASYGKTEPFVNTFSKYFRVLHICGVNVTDTKYKDLCYTKDAITYLKSRSNTSVNYTFLDDGQFVLMDGTLLIFNQDNTDKPLYLIADINGIKTKPNKLGYDVFVFQLLNEEFVPLGAVGTNPPYTQECNLKSPAIIGFTCTYNAVSDADYFKKLVRNVK